MEDGEIRIKTKIETDGVESQLDNVQKSLDKTSEKVEEVGRQAEKTGDKVEEAGKQAEKASGKVNKAGTETKKAGDKAKDASSKTKNLADSFKDLSNMSVGTIASVGAIVGVLKKTVEAIGDCVEAYKVQRQAEVSLQAAAKNNPFLNGASVNNLKQYASELQSLSNFGDEELLPLMAQLAAAGRTEEEIQKILKTSIDVASSGAMSLESAVKNLNKTYSGLSGELGEAIPQIKELTTEQLKNGDAVDVVAKQYKGMAEAVADASKQLSNSWGDFKENLGDFFEKSFSPMLAMFQNFLDDFNQTSSELKTKSTAKELANKVNNGTATTAETETLYAIYDDDVKRLYNAIQDKNAVIKQLSDAVAKADVRAKGYAQSALDKAQKELDQLKQEHIKAYTNTQSLKEYLDYIHKKEKAVADEAEREKQAIEETKQAEEARLQIERERESLNQTAQEFKNGILGNLNAQKERMELIAKLTDETVDAEALYQLYLNTYADLITKSNGLVTENNWDAQKLLEQVNGYKALAEEQAKAKEELEAYNKQLEEWSKLEKEERENLRATQKAIKEDNEQRAKSLLAKVPTGDKKGIVNEYLDKQQELEKLKAEINNNEIIAEQEKADSIKKIDEEMIQNRKDLYESLTSEITGYVDQIVDITSQASSLMMKNSELQNQVELAELEKRYEKGEIAEEEYYEKQKELKRKAAQEQYKINLFQWNMSLLMAMANIAEGVTKAIAQGGVMGVITGALVAASGAVQLASIGASKPIPPSFETGGVVGGMNGATMGSDNTYIHARNGEMIMNASQQRTLWGMLNGSSEGKNNGLNVTINNTQSNNVKTQVRQQDGTLFIDILDKHINEGFSSGTYDNGLGMMNARQQGERFL